MKLLFITRKVDKQDAHAGFIYQWVNAFARRVDELHVICLEKGDISGLPEHCHIYSLGKEHGKNRMRELFHFVRFAIKLVPRVDGVFSHQNPEYGILIAPFARLYNKTCIAWYTHKSVTWKLRVLAVLVDQIITASPESFRLKTRKVSVVHHGIDTEFFSYQPKSMTALRELVSVSRISPSKHIDAMIDLISELRKQGHPVRLTIAGGPATPDDIMYIEKLHQQVIDHALSEHVRFLGPVPFIDSPKVYHHADVFLNFSTTGSLDKAVLEAMSCGTLVLTNNEAFARDLSALDVHCFSSDSLQKLVENCTWLLFEGPHDDLQRRARDYVVERHSLSDVVGRILERYEHRIKLHE